MSDSCKLHNPGQHLQTHDTATQTNDTQASPQVVRTSSTHLQTLYLQTRGELACGVQVIKMAEDSERMSILEADNARLSKVRLWHVRHQGRGLGFRAWGWLPAPRVSSYPAPPSSPVEAPEKAARHGQSRSRLQEP